MRRGNNEPNTQTAVSQKQAVRQDMPLSRQMSVVPRRPAVPGAQGSGGGPV